MTSAEKPLSCRLCGASEMVTFADLGTTPIANAYPAPDSDPADEVWYSLHARVCVQCLLVQLPEVISPDEIFSDYAYFSSYSDSWIEHGRNFASESLTRWGLTADSLVVEVASNDGYLLKHFVERGVRVLGVEPAANVAEVAMAAGIPTVVEFFGEDLADKLVTDMGPADLLVANNVIAHVPDLSDFVAGLRTMLAPGGTLSVEFPHLLRLIEDVQFDTIYHEHFSYFSLLSMERALGLHGLRVHDVEQLSTHGGSLRVLACQADDERKDAPRLEEMRRMERAARLDRVETYAAFADKPPRCRDDLRAFLAQARDSGLHVAAYGAAAKGNTLLNYCGVTAADIAYVVDRNPHKQSRLLPGSRIPIRPPETIVQSKPDVLLILPWNLRSEIMEQMGQLRSWGGRFAVPIPRLNVLP